MFVYFCGFNGFGQFGAHDKTVTTPTELTIKDDEGNTLNLSQYSIISCSWSFIVLYKENELILHGFVKNKPGNSVRIKTNGPIKNVVSNDDTCLVLLETGALYKLKTFDSCLEKVNFDLNEKPCRKRYIFGQPVAECNYIVKQVGIGTTIAVAVTSQNSIFSIDKDSCSLIYEFPNYINVTSLHCGFEHALLLTGNGDLYTWGCGLRGQLGCDIIPYREKPELLEELAGIKMVSISAAGWHSAAVSVFGDIYIWGFNKNGQLGIAHFRPDSSGILTKNPSVYPFPQLIDLPKCCIASAEEDLYKCAKAEDFKEKQTSSCSQETFTVSSPCMQLEDCGVVRVFCGSRHTIIQRSCGKMFGTGWNKFGQLGMDDMEKDTDSFHEIYTTITEKITNATCGSWCTIIFTQNTPDK